MPKLGMEPIRRAALVKATIDEIGAAGSLEVTVGTIAKRAGMSSALAHHYFGSKDQIFEAAMRQILTDYRGEIVKALKFAQGPHQRARAIISASFSPSSFAPVVISAWMTFYVQAQKNPAALRLLRLYQQRMRSNLTHALRPICDEPAEASEMLASLIDGLYIRAALAKPEADAEGKALKLLEIITRDAA